jgi:hypothetical protein
MVGIVASLSFGIGSLGSDEALGEAAVHGEFDIGREGGGNLHYCIDVARLGEMDWEEHLSNKRWTTAPDAIRFARRIYGAARI